jgi:SAM-dependent methyltransferase
MTPEVLRFVARVLRPAEVYGRDVLEVGARNLNGSPRSVVEALRPRSSLGVDAEPGTGVDVVLTVENLVAHFGPDRFDVVVATELLEHVRHWRKAVDNLKGVLRPGGVLIVTTRSRGFSYHGFPYDFWRYELDDAARIFADLDVRVLEPDPTLPGVLLKAQKSDAWTACRLDDVHLWSILTRRVTPDIDEYSNDELRRLNRRALRRQNVLTTLRSLVPPPVRKPIARLVRPLV